MAEADDENYLDCPVCLEGYDDNEHLPKMLPCLHSLCKPCVIKIAAAPPPDDALFLDLVIRELTNTLTIRTFSERRTELQQNPSRGGATTRGTASSSNPTTSNPAASERNEVPRNRNFDCPVCRKACNTDNIQTNRYILAHIKSVNRLRAQTVRPIPAPRPSTRPPPVPLRPQRTEQTEPQEQWCLDCSKPATDGTCSPHNKVTLDEWISKSCKTVEERSALLLNRLEAFFNSNETMERMAKDLHNALGLQLQRLVDNKVTGESLKTSIRRIHSSSTAPAPNNATQKRTRAMALQEMTSELYVLKDKTTEMEGNANMASVGSLKSFMWTSDAKLYVNTSDATYAITKEDNTYAS